MCTCRMNRRTMISLSGSASLLMPGGCDDVDLVADETVEAIGLQAWSGIRQSTEVTNDAELQNALNNVTGAFLSLQKKNPQTGKY